MPAARVRARSVAAAALLLVLSACVHRGPPPAAPAPPAPPAPARKTPHAAPGGPGEVGVASYYGHRFHGRRTASGARYDMNALTCAHPTAPFGSRLRVTDLATGRSVEVVVTDRGPFARGRVVDLSLEAARRLGMVERGLTKVRVVRVE